MRRAYTYDNDLLKLADASGQLNLGDRAEVRRLASRVAIQILRPRWEKAMQTPMPEPEADPEPGR